MFGTLWENGWIPGRSSVDQFKDSTTVELTNPNYPSLILRVNFYSRGVAPISTKIILIDLDNQSTSDREAFEKYTDIRVAYEEAWHPEPDGSDEFDMRQITEYVKNYFAQKQEERR